jgi:2'-5' RNA ligase
LSRRVAEQGREESAERLRLFVALTLPQVALEVLGAWQRDVLTGEPQLRGVEGTTLHATLCFLGGRPANEVARIADACGTVAGIGAMRLRVGAGLWLPARRPSVLAVSLGDMNGALAPAQRALSGALAAAGVYRPESRPYLPHVTVARVRRGERVRRRELEPPPSLVFEADTVTLYRSLLGRSGARYEPLAAISLRGDASPPSDS